MCGRFALAPSKTSWFDRFGLYLPDNFEPMLNIAPSAVVPIVTREGLQVMHWGLIPHWAKEEKIGYSMFNARAETVAEKPSYRESFSRRRCLVPATGFYEWKGEGKKKQPYRFSCESEEVFAFAGLYDTWKNPTSEESITTFTIITTSANAMMHPYHDRMPVVIEKAFDDLWLSQENPKEQVVNFLLKEQTIEFSIEVATL